MRRSNILTILSISVLLAVSIAVRVWYISSVPSPILTFDSFGYWYEHVALTRSFTPDVLINPFRTPLYPALISAFVRLFGSGETQLYTQNFWKSMHAIVIFQSILGVISLLMFYASARILLGKKGMLPALFISLLMAVNPILFSWEASILTESIGVFVLSATVLLTMLLIQKPSARRYILFLLVSVVGFLSKPAYIFVPLCTLPFVAVYRPRSHTIKIVAVILLCYFSVPFLYIVGNTRLHGYPGISYIADVNLLGQILRFNLPVESAKNQPFYYRGVTKNREINGPTNPFRFLDAVNPDIYIVPEEMTELQLFVRTVISHAPLLFLSRVLVSLPNAVMDTSSLPAFIIPASGAFAPVLTRAHKAFGILVPSAFFIVLLLPLTLRMFIKRKDRQSAMLLMIGTLSVLFVLTNSVLGYGEFERLNAPVTPYIYLFVGYWGLLAASSIIRKKINT